MTDSTPPVLEPATKTRAGSSTGLIALILAIVVALLPLIATTHLTLRIGSDEVPHDFSSELAGALAIGLIAYSIVRGVRARVPLVPHVIAAIAVVSLGGYDIVRGVTAPAIATERERQEAALDVIHPTERFFEAWRRGDADQILAEAHPELRKVINAALLRRMIAATTGALGRYQDVKETRPSVEDGLVTVEGTARFERGLAAFTLQFAQTGGALVLTRMKIDVPEELRREPGGASADAFARATIDHLLAGDVAALREDVDPRLELDDGMIAKVRSLPRHLGVFESIEMVSNECTPEAAKVGGGPCFAYAVHGDHATITVALSLTWMLSRWEVVTVSFEVVEAR